MIEASEKGDAPRIMALSQDIWSCQETIDTAFADMEQAETRRQRLEKKFEKRLAGLEG